jgi:hypothetical protein
MTRADITSLDETVLATEATEADDIHMHARFRHLPPFAVLQAEAKLSSDSQEITLPYALLKKYIRSILVQMPFDEEFYRIENPGTVGPVERGHYKNFKSHFIDHGYFEGREPSLYYFPELEESPQNHPIPDDYFALLCDAQDLAFNGEPDQSIALLKEAARRYPKTYSANYLAGAVLCGQFRFLEALAYLSQALAVRPYRAEAINRLIGILRLFSNPTLSLKLLTDLAVRIPGTPAWLSLALTEAYLAAGDVRAARLHARKLQRPSCTDEQWKKRDALVKCLADAQGRLKQYHETLRRSQLQPSEALRALLLLAQFGRRAMAIRLYERYCAPPAANEQAPEDLALRLRLHEAFHGGQATLAAIERYSAICNRVVGAQANQSHELLQAQLETLARLGRHKDICALIDDPEKFPFESGFARIAAFAMLHEKAYIRLQRFCRNWYNSSDEKWSAYSYLVLCAFSRGLLAGINIDRKIVHREITRQHANSFASLIPKTIIQFWDTSPPPSEIEEISNTWQNMNPQFSYTIFDVSAATDFIEHNYGLETVKLFNYCHHPAMKADLFRLLYLKKCGGYYVDADDGYVEGFSWLSRQVSAAELVLVTGYSRADDAPALNLNNLFIGAIAGHMVIEAATQHAIEGLQEAMSAGLKPDIWATTGPGALTRGFQKLLLSDGATQEAVLPGIRVISGPNHFEFVARAKPMSYKSTAAGNWRLA